jgi:hypothetical protein
MSHIVICHVLMLCRGSGSPADAAGQPACHRLGNGEQVRRHQAPAHPAPQLRFAMIPAAVQAKAVAQHTDAPLDARPKSQSAPELRGPLLGDPRRWGLAGIRDDDAGDLGLLRHRLIGRGIDPTVGGQQPRGAAKAPLVCHETVNRSYARCNCAVAASPLCRANRCNYRSRRHTLRTRRRNTCGLKRAVCPTTALARRSSRLSTRTPSPRRPLSVG